MEPGVARLGLRIGVKSLTSDLAMQQICLSAGRREFEAEANLGRLPATDAGGTR